MNQASENCRDIVIIYRCKCLEQTSWKPFVSPDLGSIKHKILAYFRSKQSTVNLHSIPDQKGHFCKRREIWRETHVPMWLLIGRVIFLTREKSSFAFLIGRIIFFFHAWRISLASLIGWNVFAYEKLRHSILVSVVIIDSFLVDAPRSSSLAYLKYFLTLLSVISRNGIERLVCITGIYTQNDPGNPRWITMLRPFMRSFINDMVLMENTVMQSNLIYTMRPPFLTNGKCLFDKPAMQTLLVLVTRSFPTNICWGELRDVYVGGYPLTWCLFLFAISLL